jgi:hypothetical protein
MTAGTAGNDRGLRPGDLCRRPALLRHAVHHGGTASRGLPTASTAPMEDGSSGARRTGRPPSRRVSNTHPPDQRPGPLLAEAARDAAPLHRSLLRHRLLPWSRRSNNQAPRSSNQAPRSIGRRANGPTSSATTPNVPNMGRFIIRWCIVLISGEDKHQTSVPDEAAYHDQILNCQPDQRPTTQIRDPSRFIESSRWGLVGAGSQWLVAAVP